VRTSLTRMRLAESSENAQLELVHLREEPLMKRLWRAASKGQPNPGGGVYHKKRSPVSFRLVSNGREQYGVKIFSFTRRTSRFSVRGRGRAGKDGRCVEEYDKASRSRGGGSVSKLGEDALILSRVKKKTAGGRK